MKLTTLLLAATASLALASSASAAIVFSDGFEADAPGAPVGSLLNWDITGTVDVVAAVNPFGIAATSNVVDLDGTPGPGGITTKNAFGFSAGDLVTMSYVLGGAQRGSVSDPFIARLIFGGDPSITNLVGTGIFSVAACGSPCVGIGQLSVSGLVAGDTPYTASTFSFTALSAGNLKIGFGSSSTDNIGPLLDSVSLDITAAVPEPATWALMIGGFGMAGAMLRRRRTLAATA